MAVECGTEDLVAAVRRRRRERGTRRAPEPQGRTVESRRRRGQGLGNGERCSRREPPPPAHLVLSRPIPSYPVLSRPTPSFPVLSLPIPCYPVLSRAIPSNPLPWSCPTPQGFQGSASTRKRVVHVEFRTPFRRSTRSTQGLCPPLPPPREAMKPGTTGSHVYFPKASQYTEQRGGAGRCRASRKQAQRGRPT